MILNPVTQEDFEESKLSRKHQKFFERAFKKCSQDKVRKNASHRSVHVAILKVKNNYYFGFNSKKTHPLQDRFKKNVCAVFKHAELDAIIKATNAREDLEGATMYIARLLHDGSFGMSKPCKGCQEALEYFGINQCYYTYQEI